MLAAERTAHEEGAENRPFIHRLEQAIRLDAMRQLAPTNDQAQQPDAEQEDAAGFGDADTDDKVLVVVIARPWCGEAAIGKARIDHVAHLFVPLRT